MLNAHAIGSAITEAAITTALKRAGQTFEQVAENVEPYLQRLAPESPHYEKWRQETGPMRQEPERVLEETYAFGLERVLDGLELWQSNNRTGPPSA